MDAGGGSERHKADVLIVSRREQNMFICLPPDVTMRAWPVARSIFDAPLGEKSKRVDNRL